MRINPDGLVLLKSATFYILYPNNDNNNLVDNNSVLETDLRVFSWDGYDWKLMSSIVYPHTENEIMLRNTVKTNVHHFSDYALFEADVTKLSLDDPRPREKIITPNGDGINDYAEFNGLTGNYEVNIYDINGKRIHRITSSAAGNNPLWRGTDTQGETVNTGVYIYQIKNLDAPTAAVLSGVIVVAK
jgi:gliding motility-associated-like protein